MCMVWISFALYNCLEIGLFPLIFLSLAHVRQSYFQTIIQSEGSPNHARFSILQTKSNGSQTPKNVTLERPKYQQKIILSSSKFLAFESSSLYIIVWKQDCLYLFFLLWLMSDSPISRQLYRAKDLQPMHIIVFSVSWVFAVYFSFFCVLQGRRDDFFAQTIFWLILLTISKFEI